MKTIFLFLLIALSSYGVSAQTKRIEHRSHSGSDRTFTTKGESNFGETPEMHRRYDSLYRVRSRKDSVEKARKADSIKKATNKPKPLAANTKKKQ